MFKLTINKADGSVYWIEHFSSYESASKWLREEKTRPYWKSEFQTLTEEIKAREVSPEELAEEAARKRDEEFNEGIRKLAKKRIMETDVAKCNSVPEIKALLQDIKILISKWS